MLCFDIAIIRKAFIVLEYGLKVSDLADADTPGEPLDRTQKLFVGHPFLNAAVYTFQPRRRLYSRESASIWFENCCASERLDRVIVGFDRLQLRFRPTLLAQVFR